MTEEAPIKIATTWSDYPQQFKIDIATTSKNGTRKHVWEPRAERAGANEAIYDDKVAPAM